MGIQQIVHYCIYSLKSLSGSSKSVAIKNNPLPLPAFALLLIVPFLVFFQ